MGGLRKRLRLHSLEDDVSTQLVSEITTVNTPSPPFLPEELIVEILLRLPVRSLLQFKCVCKTWKTLISNPQFATSHLLSSTPSPLLISWFVTLAICQFVSYPLKTLLENPSTPVKPSIFNTASGTHIIGSCNGLICLHDSVQSNFRLWNPSINFESKTIPTFICFDHNLFTYCGFGYDQVNDRYKVLAVVQNKFNLKEAVTKIYTFGENSWTTIQNLPCDWQRGCSGWWRWPGKFVCGSLNWIVNKDGLNSTNQKVIVSFDVEKETYGEVLLPQHDGDNVCNPVLYVSSNCICVSFDHSKEKSWVMWMMKEYGVFESWTKLMIIPQDMLTSDIHRRPLSDALFISENSVLLLRPTYSRLVVYNLNNGGLDRHSRIFGKFALHLQIYQESLVSLQW